jgi:hypothetical protein
MALGEYELGMLTPENRTGVARHIQQCPRCIVELQMLRQFIGAELSAPSTTLMDRMRRTIATLLPPVPFASAHGALRSGGNTTDKTFRTGSVHILLDSELTTKQGQWNLPGMIWRDDDDTGTFEGSTVTLIAGHDTAQSTEIGATGDFIFMGIAPGTYRLEITLEDEAITIERFDVGVR